MEPTPTQDLPTAEQLDEMARTIHPAICSLLCAPEGSTTISFTVAPAGDGLSRMVMDVRVNGQPISPAQEELIIGLLKKAEAPGS